MASQYDLEARQIERRRQIAEALRASGNQPLPGSYETSGRFDAPVSGWEHAGRVTQQLMAALMERRAGKDETALTERQKAAQAEWIRGLGQAQAPSELQPQAPTGKLMMADGAPISNLELDPNAPLDKAAPVGLQDQMARRMKGQALFGDVQRQVNAGDREKMLSHYMKGGDIGGLAGAIGAAGLQRELLPPVAEPFTLGEGDKRYSGSGQLIASGAPKTFAPKDDRTDDIREYEMAAAAGYKGSLQEWILEQKRAGASNMSVRLPPQENAEAEAVGKFFGDQYAQTQKAGMDASSKIARFDRIEQLLDGVNTGKLAPTFATLAGYAESFGITLDENLGEKQALTALTNEIALTLRNPSGGAGMPGALSDKDREFLMTLPPGLGNTKEGNALIIETGRALAKRDQEVAKLAREYRKKNGKLDEGFGDELTAYGKANPLFSKYTGSATSTTTESAADRAKRLGVTP